MAGSSTAPDKSEYQARVGQNFRLVSASTATLRVPVARMYPDLSDVYLAAGSLSCARTQTSKLKTVYQATSDTVVQRQSFGTVVPDELSLLGLRSLRTVGPALGHYCHLLAKMKGAGRLPVNFSWIVYAHRPMLMTCS